MKITLYTWPIRTQQDPMHSIMHIKLSRTNFYDEDNGVYIFNVLDRIATPNIQRLIQQAIVMPCPRPVDCDLFSNNSICRIFEMDVYEKSYCEKDEEWESICMSLRRELCLDPQGQQQ